MKKTAIALGTFDGVHIGHCAVLKAAAVSGEFSVAVAFKIPPKAFFTKTGIILTDTEQKTALIKDTGITAVDYLDFEKVKDVSPEDFLISLKEKYAPEKIVCGYDYTFGKGGKGDTELLKEFCDKFNIELCVIDKVSFEGQAVSSSLIRELLKQGETEKANRLLGHHFSFKSAVIHGEERGRKMSFPTVNQLYGEKNAEVKFGVYMSKAQIDGKEYLGMTNIGIRPTYPVDAPLCETNLFGFTGDLYGQKIRLYLLEFIREEKKFSTLNQLKEAIKRDKEYITKRIGKE